MNIRLGMKLLSEDYDFKVTYIPTEYPNYGKGYRFCELVRKSDRDEKEILYVAAIYSRDAGVIKLRYGTIGTSLARVLEAEGIGPLKLEKIKDGTSLD